MRILPLLVLGFWVIALCASTAQMPALQPPSPLQTPGPTTTATYPAVSAIAELILTNANILTMDETHPLAQALALRGDSILAVGTNLEIIKYQGKDTVLVDLQGKTVVPGFIDSHQYRIQKRLAVGIPDAGTIIQAAIRQGWTTLDELYVDQALLDQLRELDQLGTLRVRINAYLPFMQYDADGTPLGNWYKAYHQGQLISPHVRVAGLIGFADFDNATILLWKQPDLNAFLLKSQQEGWSTALKTVSTHSLEMILDAYEYVKTVDPKVVDSRGRLEHALFITADQIVRIKQLGLIPVINLNNPGQLVGEAEVDALIAREPKGSYTPLRSLEEAGIRVAEGTGWPSYYVEEPKGAPFGSPMHLIYQAITRVGNLGTQPYPWLLDQTLTAEQALRAMTINSAYAAFEEKSKGSLESGKVADLVILSDNPLSVSPEQINNIQVLVTMIGGRVEWCAPDGTALCNGAMTDPTAARDRFTGDWVAIDPSDSSNMTLRVIHNADIYNVVLVDEQASICGLDTTGKPKYAAELDATGTANGNALSTTVTLVKCLSQPPTFIDRNFTVDYTLQSTADELVDSIQGAVWKRQ